jgi:hypothetical protein
MQKIKKFLFFFLDIMANVIAFVAFFRMLDLILIWFFEMINLDNFGFGVKFIISYL